MVDGREKKRAREKTYRGLGREVSLCSVFFFLAPASSYVSTTDPPAFSLIAINRDHGTVQTEIETVNDQI